MATARYQGGCITLKKRAKGPDVWEFRWRDVSAFENFGFQADRTNDLVFANDVDTATPKRNFSRWTFGVLQAANSAARLAPIGYTCRGRQESVLPQADENFSIDNRDAVIVRYMVKNTSRQVTIHTTEDCVCVKYGRIAGLRLRR